MIHMYRLTILKHVAHPLMTPLENSPCTRVPLTYLESLLSVWCDPCPPWSQAACKLTSPSPFPFPPPTVPQINYAPSYDDITTPTSLSSAHFHITIAVNVVNDTYGTWTLLKVVLTPLTVNHYQLLKKLTALTVNDLHSPTICCPLNVNGLLHK